MGGGRKNWILSTSDSWVCAEKQWLWGYEWWWAIEVVYMILYMCPD